MEMVSFPSILFGLEGPKLFWKTTISTHPTPGPQGPLRRGSTSPGPMEFPEPTGSIEPPTQATFGGAV